MPELDLAVDTQIVLIGCGMSDIAATPEHERLLSHFLDIAFLALDEGQQIETEYERKMSAESVGRIWLRQLAQRDRIRKFKLADMPRKVKVALDREHFHPSDRKFVRLAMATESKILVAGESDYSKGVRKVLKKDARIDLHSAQSACERIESSPAESADGASTE